MAVIHTTPLARSVTPTMKIAVSPNVMVHISRLTNCLSKLEELGLEQLTDR
jgi:hypothetical protein